MIPGFCHARAREGKGAAMTDHDRPPGRSQTLGQWMTIVAGVAVLAGVLMPRNHGRWHAQYRAVADALVAVPAASLLIAYMLAGARHRLALGRFAWSTPGLLLAGVVLVNLSMACLVGTPSTAVSGPRQLYLAGAIGGYLGLLWLCRPPACPRCGERAVAAPDRPSPGTTRCEACDAPLVRGGRGPWALDPDAPADAGLGWAPGFAPGLGRLRRDLRPGGPLADRPPLH